MLRIISTRHLRGARYGYLIDDDLVRIVAERERSDLKDWTKHDCKLIFRMFLDRVGGERRLMDQGEMYEMFETIHR
ncbi:MAG: hypothetical protein ACP5E9_08390 [Candidatus Methanospirareceae archaeon]